VLDVFVRGPLNHLYHKSNRRVTQFFPGGGFSQRYEWLPSQDGWVDLGGDVWGTPSAVGWGPDRLDIAVVGNNGNPLP
jgi:hypothetical protein